MKKILLLLLAVVSFNSCSLLKFSIETGETPLTEQEYDTRSMTRGLYSQSANNIISLSDSIVSSDVDIDIKLRAIRWKIATTQLLAEKALQTTPDAALLDTWIASKQLSKVFHIMPDSLLLGEYSELARMTIDHTATQIEKIAKDVNTRERYKLMQEFVALYMEQNPLKANEFPTINSILSWIDFLETKQIEYVHTKGTTAEVVSGMSDQVFGQVNQFANNLEWSKDMIELKFAEDSLNSKFMQELENLDKDFDRMLVFLEESPELLEFMTKEMSIMLEQSIMALNQNVNFAFQNFDTQRDELQLFIDQQREILIKEATASVEQTIQNTLDEIPALIRSVLIYIILFVFIIFGLPFALGFWLGGKKKEKKDS